VLDATEPAARALDPAPVVDALALNVPGSIYEWVRLPGRTLRWAVELVAAPTELLAATASARNELADLLEARPERPELEQGWRFEARMLQGALAPLEQAAVNPRSHRLQVRSSFREALGQARAAMERTTPERELRSFGTAPAPERVASRRVQDLLAQAGRRDVRPGARFTTARELERRSP
jgi:hypothetical protein